MPSGEDLEFEEQQQNDTTPFVSPTNNGGRYRTELQRDRVNVTAQSFVRAEQSAPRSPVHHMSRENPQSANSVFMRTGSTPNHIDTNNGRVVSTMVSEYVVPEDSKMRYLTYKGYFRTDALYQEYINSAIVPSKRFVNWMSVDVLKKLIEYERKRDSEVCSGLLNMGNIYTMSDEKIKMIIAGYLRPTTPQEYIQGIRRATTVFKPTVPNYEIEPLNYDLYMHSPVSLLVEEVMDYHLLCRLGATEEELRCMPREDFGSEKQPGVLRVILQLLGKFEECFIYKIDEGKIRNMRSVDELINAIKVANTEMAKFSSENRKSISKWQPPNLKLYSLPQAANSSTSTIVKSRDYDRRLGQAQLKYPSRGGVQNSLNRLSYDESVGQNDDSKSDESAEMYDEVDDVEDRSELAGNYDDRVKMLGERELSIDDEGQVVDNLMASDGYQKTGYNQKSSFQRNPLEGRKSEILKKTDPAMSVNTPIGVCFAYFTKEGCLNGKTCRYSHDPEVLEKYRVQQLAIFQTPISVPQKKQF